LENHPTAELHNLVASFQESAGHYVEAVHHYQIAVELEPTNEQYYFDLGLEYLAHFTFGPAIDVFQVGIKKFPGVSRQYEGKGLAHYAMREYPQAADAFLTALEMSPSSPSAFAAWNALQSALDPLELERVLPRLKSLAQTHPKSAEAKYCYGQALLNQSLSSNQPEQLSLVQTLIEEVCRLKPDFAPGHLLYGNLFLARKEPEKAIAEFQETIRLDARNEMAHYRLGQTYRNQNQLELAQQQLALHAQLVKTRRELMARSRSAIKQFVLAQSGSKSGAIIQAPNTQ
jgi:tetratricopeptide (TPR) repeat protein